MLNTIVKSLLFFQNFKVLTAVSNDNVYTVLDIKPNLISLFSTDASKPHILITHNDKIEITNDGKMALIVGNCSYLTLQFKVNGNDINLLECLKSLYKQLYFANAALNDRNRTVEMENNKLRDTVRELRDTVNQYVCTSKVTDDVCQLLDLNEEELKCTPKPKLKRKERFNRLFKFVKENPNLILKDENGELSTWGIDEVGDINIENLPYYVTKKSKIKIKDNKLIVGNDGFYDVEYTIHQPLSSPLNIKRFV